MNIDPFLIWLESTALSQWVVGSESMFAFPGILAVHAIGMGFAVGICLALDLRILGVAPGIQITEMRRFVPVVWVAFWINAISGVLLLIGYPTKALTNPVFYLKLFLIGVGLTLFVRIGRRVFGETGTPERERLAGGAGDSPSSRSCAGSAPSRRAVSSPTPITA